MHNNLGFVQKMIKKWIKTETCDNCVIFENLTDKTGKIWMYSMAFSWSWQM